MSNKSESKRKQGGRRNKQERQRRRKQTIERETRQEKEKEKGKEQEQKIQKEEKSGTKYPIYVIGIDPGNHYGFFIAQVWFPVITQREITLQDILNVNVYFWFSCTVNTIMKILPEALQELRKIDEEISQRYKQPLWHLFIEDQFISYKRSSLKLTWNAGYVYGLLEGLMFKENLQYKGPYKVHPSYWYNLFMQPESDEYYTDEFLKSFNIKTKDIRKVGYSYPRQSQHAFEAMLISLAGIIRYFGQRKRKKRKKKYEADIDATTDKRE